MVVGLVGCGGLRGEAALVDSCEGDDCTPCDVDTECIIAHNPCSEFAYCGHVDDELAVTQIGCDAALEYDTPAPARCVCDDVCRAESPDGG
jgi:hypothetical protein